MGTSTVFCWKWASFSPFIWARAPRTLSFVCVSSALWWCLSIREGGLLIGASVSLSPCCCDCVCVCVVYVRRWLWKRRVTYDAIRREGREWHWWRQAAVQSVLWSNFASAPTLTVGKRSSSCFWLSFRSLFCAVLTVPVMYLFDEIVHQYNHSRITSSLLFSSIRSPFSTSPFMPQWWNSSSNNQRRMRDKK